MNAAVRVAAPLAGIAAAAVVLCAGVGCAKDSPSHALTPHAKLLPPTNATDLATVHLTAEAEAALRLSTAKAVDVDAALVVSTGGEVMVPAGREVVLAAPVGGRVVTSAADLPRPGQAVRAGELLLTLVPIASVDRDVRARADNEVAVAQASLELAKSRTARAEAMVQDRSGSVRAVEEARQQQQVAEAAVAAAAARAKTLERGSLDSDLSLPVRSTADGVVRAVRVTASQSFPAGAPLIEIAAAGRWVRATLTAADAARFDAAGTAVTATARRLGTSSPTTLIATAGPPSADPLRGTVDRFFALPADAVWTPGERVVVDITLGGAAGVGVVSQSDSKTVAVPFASVVRDAEGAAWVYEKAGDHTWRRRRVDVLRRDGEHMLLRRGPTGAEVVAVGAAELWGFELGADR